MKESTRSTPKQVRRLRPSPVKSNVSEKRIDTVLRGVHVVPDSEGWRVIRAAAHKRPRHFKKQSDAVEFAAQVCTVRGGIVFIHSKGGKVREAPARALREAG